MSDERKRVIFVDDEPRILDGIRRMMRPLHEEWDMRFAGSGREALKILSKEKFDVIVTDMRMPEMSGAELLIQVQKLHPYIVRIVLSGMADRDMIVRAAGPIHQYLAKPCDVETLKSAVVRSTGLRDLLHSDKIKGVVSQTESLPSLPRLYLELVEELKKPDTSLRAVERIISRDLGMTMKVLQLVNSAFFGVRRHVSSPADAVRLLGLDNIQSLVLSVQVFSQFKDADSQGLTLQRMWEHSMWVGACSKAIAKYQHADPLTLDNAFIGGLLHDVGKLIIASRFPREHLKISQRIETGRIQRWEAEIEIIGASHAEIGAYLLGLWGFSDPIVEAAAFHHHPMVCFARGFSPLTAVHAANAIVDGIEHPNGDQPGCPLNEEYLQDLGLAEEFPKWQEICSQVTEQKDQKDGTKNTACRR
jgi:putative nucleotidyltransferase with HDIG domain